MEEVIQQMNAVAEKEQLPRVYDLEVHLLIARATRNPILEVLAESNRTVCVFPRLARVVRKWDSPKSPLTCGSAHCCACAEACPKCAKFHKGEPASPVRT
jgi:hypothetical protein